MLSLRVEQHEWVMAQERERLAVALENALPVLWPSLAQQLGPRCTGFVRASLQAAHQHDMGAHRHAVYLFTLWCVWGPSFESKPDFAWAREVLSDPTRAVAVKIQQLILQTRARLQQLGAQVKPEALDHALAYVEALLVRPQVRSWVSQDPAQPEPQVLCDFQLIEIESLDQPWRKEYAIEATAAGDLVAVHKAALVPRQSYRIDHAILNPEVMQLAVLAQPIAQGVKAILHVRGDMGQVCHRQLHPRMAWSHAHGMDVSEGHAQQRRPLYCLELAGVGGVGQAGLASEPQPVSLDFAAQSCGLRLAGAPIREHKMHVRVWPASQWLAEVRNGSQPELRWPSVGGEMPARLPDVLLVQDGQVVSTPYWQQAWQQLLPQLQEGVGQWVRNLERDAVLQQPKVSCLPNLMHGRSMLTWGMREEVQSSGSRAFLRIQAEGEWVACGTDLVLQAQLHQGSAVARIKLRSVGEAKLKTCLARETNKGTLLETLAQARVCWSHPFMVELEAVSTSDLAMLVLDMSGPVGGLCGEAGLRPRKDGQGYEWYCQVHLQAMQLQYMVWDPLAGIQRYQRELWPQTPLLDWSAG